LDKDRLINLLPEEYLPEPEFKAFPIFAAVLIILTVLFIYLNYQKDNKVVLDKNSQLRALQAQNQASIAEVDEFLEIQANARFLRSYLAVIPNMVLQSPDYWAIYNEIEDLLPEETWVTSVNFRRGRGAWPDIVVNFLSRGYGFYGPLATYDAMKGTPQSPTRFRNLRMGGYQRTMVGGTPAAQFQIQMEVTLPREVSGPR
jgi:hypothetical protein